MLTHIKDIVSQAENDGYAIGAFNIHNLETVIGVVKAAKTARSPIIIQVSEGAIKYMGLKIITNIVATEAREMAKEVPIALHLDHGRSFESVMECIKAGFSSVHIDASNLPLDENILITRKVVEIAHTKGVWVQGEVGAIMGSDDGRSVKIENIPIADAEEVVKFVKETGVDTIAAAIGTAHGVNAREDVKIALLKDIKKRTKIPFVLHGGSGVSDKKIKEAIKNGVNIINIGSDIKNAFCTALIDTCLQNRDETDPRNLLKPSIAAVEAAAMKAMKLFKSVNQAKYKFIET